MVHQDSNTRHPLARVAVALVALAALVACAADEPVQSVNFKDRLNIDISQQWVSVKESKKKASYKLEELKEVRLEFVDQTADFGTPMTVQGVRAAVGTELNQAFGGVDAKLSYGGNAVITYNRSTKYGSKKVYTHNWVVAKPFGYGAIARVAITLRVPEGQQDDPAIQELVSQLDEHVGDAVMPVS